MCILHLLVFYDSKLLEQAKSSLIGPGKQCATLMKLADVVMIKLSEADWEVE